MTARADAALGTSAVEGLRSRAAALARELAVTVVPGERDALRHVASEMLAEVEQALGDLGTLREELRALVATRDPVTPTTAAAAAAPWAEAATPGGKRADLLGASTFIEKGWHLIAAGEPQAAIGALQRALELAPGSSEAETLLGWAQLRSEALDAALATFSRVLAREPGNALARVHVGYICLRKGIFGEAIEHLTKAIRLDSDRRATLYAHLYLGLVYLEREMYQDAQAFFRRTLQMGPNLVEAYAELGRAQWFAGDREGALKTWADGERANRFNPWARRCAELARRAAAEGAVPRGPLSA